MLFFTTVGGNYNDLVMSQNVSVEFVRNYKDSVMSQNVLIQFIRNHKGVPCGVMAAVKREDGEIHINYSLCNTKLDKFNKELGKQIAIGRAMRNNDDEQHLPRSLYSVMDKFLQRACRYYQVSRDEVFCW